MPEDSYQKVGTAYYHSGCYEEKETMNRIVAAFHERINPTSPVSQIRQVVNMLIYKGGYEANYILYLIDYVANHHMGLNHPPGMKYYVDNAEIRDAYFRHKLGSQPKESLTTEIPAIERFTAPLETKKAPGRLSYKEIIARRSKKK